MRNSKTLAKLRDGLPARVCALGHYIPAFVKHAAHFNYDCIWLDLEHRLISEREVQSLLAQFHLADIDCMVRVPTLGKTELYRYLEEGATGIMVPHVSTAEKARMLVDAVKFPPLGDRGLDGAGMDSDFQTVDADEYIEHSNRETFLVVQIETPEAVANVDEIASVDGVDLLFVGPGDLGLRLKHTDVGTLDDALKKVAEACERHGKSWACPAGSLERVKELHDLGARFIPFGGDFGAIKNMLQGCSEELDGLYGGA